jgi:hypothetical protein
MLTQSADRPARTRLPALAPTIRQAKPFGHFFSPPLQRPLMRAWVLFLTLPLAVSPLAGQVKYTPDHPVVQEMIRRGMAYIEKEKSTDFGFRVMYAMAAYKSNVLLSSDNPKEHPLIDEAVHAMDNLSMSNLENGQSFRTMYSSALACVLLLELDPVKYRDKIQLLLDYIAVRQQAEGAWGYRESNLVGDTSQMQYIALALWLAKQKGFKVDPSMCKRALDWMVKYQQPNGGWIYKNPSGIDPSAGTGATTVRHSLVAAGLGTVYLYADTLQLFDRQLANANAVRRDLDLPRAVIDVTNETDEQRASGARNSLISYDTGALRGVMNKGNNWFRQNFAVEVDEYNLYFLYGFERYISLRQYLDGELPASSGLADWYDRGVEFLKRIQVADGHFESSEADITDDVNTAFAILFLTQSMSITLGDAAQGKLRGFQDFRSNVILREHGDRIVTGSIEKSLSDFLDLMATSEADELELFAGSLTDLGLDGDNVSRGEQLQQMRELVKNENWKARLIAVKFLGRQRSLDNVPALIFALTDPEPQVVHAANQGMMFVSRKTTAPEISAEPEFNEKAAAVKRWTEWYMRIMPDAQLLELPEEYQKK